MMYILVVWCSFMVYVANGCQDEHYYSGESRTAGYFWSPDFDKPYPPLVKCRFFFEGSKDERIRFTFNDFDLENGTKEGQCVKDYVDIYSIDDTDFKNPLIRVCGNNKPNPVVTLHSRAEIVFTADRYSNGQKGFHMKYEFLDERWSPFTSDQRCGSTYLNGRGGVIASPGYPFAYDEGTECSWMIRVEEDKTILLNIVELDIGVEVHCDRSAGYLDIYNGFASLTRQSDLVQRFCGQTIYYKGVKDLSIRSKSFRMTLRWFGGRIPNLKGSTGFKLSWTEVYIPQKGELCPGFQCRGGKSCADSVGLLCRNLPEYCIDETLTCNDLPNCDILDQSDEAHCLTPLLLAICIILPLLAVVGLIVAICIFRRKRRHRNTTHKTESKKVKERDRTLELEKLDTSPRLTARPGEQYSKPIRKKSSCSPNGDTERKGSNSSLRKSLTNELNVKFTHTNRHTISPSIKTSHKKDYKKSPDPPMYNYHPVPTSNGPGSCGIGPYDGSDVDQDLVDFPPPPLDYPPPIDYPTSPGSHTYVNKNAQVISPNKSNHSIV
ncbi:unnamed protein product [Owenia fusiformis]|uniref:CUB domain-containing protein n=1 Tax=Owenia fusiformis TaxID=6347 RepID=A0A8S4Q5P5_OWEFU|nr:unnamed protein product [Owenia fusiformis]